MTETLAAPTAADKRLFAGCFLALIATAFAFIVRAMLISTWGHEFGLTKTQEGEIFGVGLWPFAISIILFSLVIDRIGYGVAMAFAFACHVGSAILTIFARDYHTLWVATFIVALGNGTVEAVINPVIATMFARDKTKWLNILHAGWPGGLVLGGVIAMFVGVQDEAGDFFTNWKVMVGLLLIPAVGYGLLLLRCRFPVQERVAAGVSDRDMLRQVGAMGALIVAGLVAVELCRVFAQPQWVGLVAGALIAAGFGAYTQSLGQPLFVILLALMVPLATTELGVDGWVTPLMEGQMKPPVLVLMYTAFLMMCLRLFAGPIVHRLSPLGLLMASSVIAALGLLALSQASGAMIFVAATLYAAGKTFFWPTMLGVVSERFPHGGALAINATGGVGMLGVGVVGAVFLGLIQDKATVRELEAQRPALIAQVVVEKQSVFGAYTAVDPEKAKAIAKEDQEAIETIGKQAQKGALSTAAIFPVIMLVSYLGLWLWFRAKGGYRAVHLE